MARMRKAIVVAGFVLLAPGLTVRQVSAFNGCPPGSKGADKCETALAKALGKFVGSVIKCHTKQADALFKNAPMDDEDCEQGTSSKSAKSKLDVAITNAAPNCPAGLVQA